ncbi:alpha/beta hydrolase [Sphingomonas lenta]|uniref:Lysophospholipase n=1 Tax=Sphingomonas lenta TaxID=1141887 RepID=A0A2A2SHG4_9SPHN|nr:alpha/beta hydrolase [Sphingomonas lenta]PAX08610.1 lysophospholipase [Sphingomonas lenta]
MTGAPEPWDAGDGLAGYVWRAAEPRGRLLLQHGFGEYAERYVERYSRLIPRLTGVGFDVYAFDAPGHGRSPGRRGVVDVRELVARHLAARRELARGGGPLFLFGHSLGGLVTAASVAREPDGVAAVVLSGPALLIEANAPTRWLAAPVAGVAPALGIRPPLDPAGVSRLEEEVRLYAADPMVYRGKLPALVGVTAVAVAREGWGRYPEWRAPTLVVHGTADTFTDPEGSRRFVGTIRSEDKRLLLVPDGRHELLNDLDREHVAEVVLTWLRDRLPADR